LEEFASLKSHFAISSPVWGGRRKRPLVFTEHGTIMAASVLKELENKLTSNEKQILAILDAIRQLMTPPINPKRKIGFNLKEKQARYGKKR
jgi:hypothetical protein